MKNVQGYYLISPGDLVWRPSNLMRIPNADFLERTGSEILGARLWRLPPNSANTLHKHIRAEEFYFVLEGTGRLRVGNETLTVQRHGGVLVGPEELRQVFNDTDTETLWLIVAAPEELEFLQGSKSSMDLKLIYPVEPTQLPPQLAGTEWPPRGEMSGVSPASLEPVDFEKFTDEWLAAWNAHDLDRIVSHYADDAEFHSPFIEKLTGKRVGILRGKIALRDYFSKGLLAYPTLRFERIRLYTGVQSCVLEYRSVNNLRAAEMMDFSPRGKVRRAVAHYGAE